MTDEEETGEKEMFSRPKRNEAGTLISLKCTVYSYTSSTAQGGGGSFKNRKRIGDIDCCE